MACNGGACVIAVAVAAFATLLVASRSVQARPASHVARLEHVKLTLPPFPLEDVVGEALQNVKDHQHKQSFQPSGFTQKTYLEVIAPVVLHFRQFQNKDPSSAQYGRIIDPYEGKEIQYSTPTFAFAGATLVRYAYFNETLTAEVLNDVSLATTAALTALAFGQPKGEHGCAQGHCNFYTMPLMLTLKALDGVVSDAQMDKWRSLAESIDPRKAYRGWPGAVGNWAIVALTGEYLRYTLGLRESIDDIVQQLQYQFSPHVWTANGQYQDHTGCAGACNPMPYDHFPRKYMTVMLDAGYNTTNASMYWEMNRRGAWVSLLMQSSWGELPTGGRSSQHQWNEAVSCVTYEYWARHYFNAGDTISAAVFKRAASLSLRSLMRWKRQTGDWFILKNRFDPKLRHGYESYSYYSQYNLLPASMLATAHMYAMDTIEEMPAIAEVGGFVFQPEGFHKVIANANGTYVETELYADSPMHDSTGLTRVHHPLSDPLVTTTAGAPYKMEGAPLNPSALGPGIAWYMHSEETVNATVKSESPSYDPLRFHVSNILWSNNTDDTQSKLWLLPHNTTGGFTLDLGLSKQNIVAFVLCNTHNSHYNDYGTNNFTIQVRNSSTDAWSTVVQGFLPDMRNQGRVNPTSFPAPGPLSARFVRVWITSFYGKGGGLNSFSIQGVKPHTVQKTRSQSLANLSFVDMGNTSLTVHSSGVEHVSYTVEYKFLQAAKAPVTHVKENYKVHADSVTVESEVVGDVDIDTVVMRVPVFLTDGERNTTWTINMQDEVVVALHGDAVSQLNTTCATYTVAEPVVWHVDGSTSYYARNGYMALAEAWPKDPSARSLTLTITPSATCSPLI